MHRLLQVPVGLRHPSLLQLLLIVFGAAIFSINVHAKAKDLYLTCDTGNATTAWLLPPDYGESVERDIQMKRNKSKYCVISDLTYHDPMLRFVTVKSYQFEETPREVIYDSKHVLVANSYESAVSGGIRWRDRAKRNMESGARGRFRGQTQSQYLAIDRGSSGKDDGKAEAHSDADSSRASVISGGSGGMGQAQSQSVYDPSCDECHGRSELGPESMKTPLQGGTGTQFGRGPHGSGIGDGPSQGGTGAFKPGQGTQGGNSPGSGTNGGLDGRGGNTYGPYGQGNGDVSGGNGPGEGQQPGNNGQYLPGQTGAGNGVAPGQLSEPGRNSGFIPSGVGGNGSGGTRYPPGQTGPAGYWPWQTGATGTNGGYPGQTGPGGSGRYSPQQTGTGGYGPSQTGTGGYDPGQNGGNGAYNRYLPVQTGTGKTGGYGPEETRGQGGNHGHGPVQTGGPGGHYSYGPGQTRTGGNLGYRPGQTGGQSENNGYDPRQTGFGQFSGPGVHYGYEPGQTSGLGVNNAYRPGQTGGTGGQSVFGSGPNGSGGPVGTDLQIGGGNYYPGTATPGQAGGTGGQSVFGSGPNGSGGPVGTDLQTGGGNYYPGTATGNPFGNTVYQGSMPGTTGPFQGPGGLQYICCVADTNGNPQNLGLGGGSSNGPNVPLGTGNTRGTYGPNGQYGPTGTGGSTVPYGNGPFSSSGPQGQNGLPGGGYNPIGTAGIPNGVQRPSGTTGGPIGGYGSTETAGGPTGIAGGPNVGSTGGPQAVYYPTGTGVGPIGAYVPIGTTGTPSGGFGLMGSTRGPNAAYGPTGTAQGGGYSPPGTAGGPIGEYGSTGNLGGPQNAYDPTGIAGGPNVGSTGGPNSGYYPTGTAAGPNGGSTGGPNGGSTRGHPYEYGPTGTAGGPNSAYNPVGSAGGINAGSTGGPNGGSTRGPTYEYGPTGTAGGPNSAYNPVGSAGGINAGSTGGPFGGHGPAGTVGRDNGPYGLTGTAGGPDGAHYPTGTTGGPNRGYVPTGSAGGPNGRYGPAGGPSSGFVPAGTAGGPNNEPNGNSGYGINQWIPGANGDSSGVPQNVIDPNSVGSDADGDDSLAEASVSQASNGTIAIAASKGGNEKGRAQTQVQGAYTGSGSFSAQAEITGENKAANSEVTGDKKGASSNAQGSGRNNKSQANVKLGSETGSILTGSQSDGAMHSSNTQVQGSVKGGMADAQARGPGSTSSQAQIGFTPYKEGDKSHDLQTNPFVGGGTSSAQSSGRTGMSQSQLRGVFKYGITYNGAAQSGASVDKDAVFPNRLTFDKIDVYDDNNKNINVDLLKLAPPEPLPEISNSGATNVIPSTDIPFSDEVTTERVLETTRVPLDQGDSHPHSDHHKTKTEPLNANRNPSEENRRSFQPNYSTNSADYDYNAGKDDNLAEEYDIDDGYGTESNDAPETDNEEYNSYNKLSSNSATHESLNSPRRKGVEVRQTTGGNTQHILLGSLHEQDAEITQQNSERPDEKRTYQPGERVPGTGGYTIPIGFTGSVKSVSSKDQTYVVGSKDSPSQAQTVSLSPGTGKVTYTNPPSYRSRTVNPKNLRSLYSPKPDDNSYVSVSKSVTRSLDDKDNIRKQYSHTYYTKSSSCGYFTFTCTMVSGSNGRKKVCKPKLPTNPDGSLMRC